MWYTHTSIKNIQCSIIFFNDQKKYIHITYLTNKKMGYYIMHTTYGQEKTSLRKEQDEYEIISSQIIHILASIKFYLKNSFMPFNKLNFNILGYNSLFLNLFYLALF